MRMRNPVGASDRCGVRIARNGFLDCAAIALGSSGKAIYPEDNSNCGGSMAGARRLKPEQAEEIFRRFRARDPEPKGELESVNPFTLLVAVVLSAQATDAGVNRATAALFKVADTPEKMASLGEARLTEYIKSIGLYRMKAKNVIGL